MSANTGPAESEGGWPASWSVALSDAALAEASSAAIVVRGAAYARSGAVRVEDEDPMPEPALRARVTGTSTCDVEVWIAGAPRSVRGARCVVRGRRSRWLIERGARKIGVEIKFCSAPKPKKGFWQALQDLQIDRACVVAPVLRGYPLGEGVEVVPVERIGAICAF